VSLKELFGKKSTKLLSSTSIEELGEETESTNYVRANLEDRFRFVPDVDFSNPNNFAKFGSAEKYYEDAINNIIKTYPYDGSLFEKLDWHNSSSNFQNYFFEEEYPRTTGYVTLGLNYGSLVTSSNGYGEPATQEYITFKGGMNLITGSSNKLSDLFKTSNKYDPDTNRELNLEFGGESGATVEFWLKKNSLSGSEKEVVFDLWNSGTFGTDSYGRFRVEIHPGISGEGNQFFVEISSGSSGVFQTALGNNLDITGSSWNQYALAFINSGSALSLKLYENGDINDSVVTGSSISDVTGTLIGTIGALSSPVSGVYGAQGWGKLSGSIDEFRYWKARRTDKKIGRYWFTQVGGGTNTDDANTDLGVYYKFNEGILNNNVTSVADAKVLDYSGRVTNANWVGYALGARNTGSAIEESSASLSEFRDPIIYPSHPDVISLSEAKAVTGSLYDRDNNAAFINNFPTWILEEDGGGLENLSQIIAEYFDDLYLKIEALPRLKDNVYREGKPLPFASRLLESIGFTAPELFTDITSLESVLSRDENRNFEEKIHDVRNQIYQNIYNNIVYIYRSKGTEKSIRNLIRCFGVDDEIINLNMYADNVTFFFDDRYRYTTVRKKYVDFNDPDRFDSTVYQMTSSSPDSTSFISGNINAGYVGTTFEAECIFPRKFPRGSPLFFRSDFITASLFGMHEADPSNPGDTTWFGSDRADLRVYAVRPEEESKDAYFRVTSSYLGIDLTSSLYPDVYDNEKWNFAVKIYHEKYPLADGVLGSEAGDYVVEFQGVNAVLDSVQNEFNLSTIVSGSLAEGHMEAAKRIYVGAHRENFTGSLVVGGGNTDEFSDAKISSVRYWINNLSESIVREHAKDALNFGSEDPYWNVEAFNSTALSGTYVPQIKTLALHWDFETVTGSDNGSGLPPLNQSDAQFVVDDATSGSATETGSFGWIGKITQRQHTGRGDFFLRNDTDVVQREYVFSAEHRLPETLNNDDLVQILSQDDEIFTRDSTPVNHYFVLEKSMYQTISKEMLKFFGTVRAFNNLVGEPANRYRQEYRSLRSLNTLFWQNVKNTPDFEKYIEFYKWVDDAVNQMVKQMIPASANFSIDELSNIIESHVLERNKYWNKLPTIELKQEPPIGPAKTINELKYNWKTGHAPFSLEEEDNCVWWLRRAERNDKTGVDLNSDRAGIFAVTLSTLNRRFSTVYDLESDAVTIIDEDPKTPTVVKQASKFGSNGYLLIELGDLVQSIDCDDE
jgi:hypothetical protein